MHILKLDHLKKYLEQEKNIFDNIAYLDIETTGLDKKFHEITLIGVYDTKKTKVFINGYNLDHAKEYLKKYNYLVTFNGYMFDLPFIKHKLNFDINMIHFDLRFILKDLGYTGGLKKIEKIFGISRDTFDINGKKAVVLWKNYLMGDLNSLNKLISYNKEDVENLHLLFEKIYNHVVKNEKLF